MADQIKVPIVSTYDSKGGDAALKQAQAIDQAKPKLAIGADTKAATKDIDGLLKKVDLLDKDTATILLTSNATAIAKDITDLVIDLDRLDKDDPNIEVTAKSINDLKGDLDTIENKLKEVNGVEVKPQVDTSGIDRAKKSSGEAAETFQRGIGPLRGFTDELGGTSSAAGTMANAVIDGGEAIQVFGAQLGLSEKALGTLSGVLGGIGVAVGVGVLVWQAWSSEQAKVAEATKKATKAVTDQLDEIVHTTDQIKSQQTGDPFLTAILGEIDENQLKNVLTGIGGIGKTIDDLGPTFQAVNKDAQAFFRDTLAKAGTDPALINFFARVIDETDNWNEALAEVSKTGVPSIIDSFKGLKPVADSLDLIQDAVEDIDFDKTFGQAILRLAATEEGAKALAQAAGEFPDADPIDLYTKAVGILKDRQAEAAQATREANTQIELNAVKTEQAAAAQQESADLLDRVNALLHEQADALNAQVDAAGSAADAQRDENKAMEAFAKTLDDAKASAEDQADAAIALAKAHQQTAVAQAAASGATLTATQRLDTQNTSLLNTAANLKGPAKAAVLGYVADLNQIPPDKRTDFIAHAMEGDLATTTSELNGVSVTRTASIRADADDAAAASTSRQIDNVANPGGKPRTANIFIRADQGPRRFGGMAGPGGSIAGEAGAEFVRFPGTGDVALLNTATLVPPGTQVTSAFETERILREHERETIRTGGAAVTNVTVNVPRGTRPDDMVRAADRYARRNGRAHASRH